MLFLCKHCILKHLYIRQINAGTTLTVNNLLPSELLPLHANKSHKHFNIKAKNNLIAPPLPCPLKDKNSAQAILWLEMS